MFAAGRFLEETARLNARLGAMELAMTTTNASGRLGYVLHWTGVVIGLLLAAIVFRLTSPGSPKGAGIRWPDALIAAVDFIRPYLIGRAACFVPAGH